MDVIINGESREVSSATTLRELVRLLELQEDRVAVELNRTIVRRDRWAETRLQNQDKLEIVQFVGGG